MNQSQEGPDPGRNEEERMRNMKDEICEFINYLHNVKKASHNTEISYERDLKKMANYLESQGVTAIEQVNATNLNSYMLYLEREQLSPATVSRSVAAIRAFFQFETQNGRVKPDPSIGLTPPKVERKIPEILSVQEVDLLMRQPDEKTPKGIRDKAMLELLYATGIRVSELIHLKVTEINLQMGYIACHEGSKDRVVPFGSAARKALERYVKESRSVMLGARESEYLFVNCSGTPMSRQGFWKILKKDRKSVV